MLADKIREEKTGREGRNKAMNGTKGRGKRKDRTKRGTMDRAKGGQKKGQNERGKTKESKTRR